MPEDCKTKYGEGEEMKLRIGKILLETALIFQAKQDVRYYLNGICFMKDGRIAATDGHRAFIGSKHENQLEDNVIVSISKSPVKRYDMAELDTDTGIVTYNTVFKSVNEDESIEEILTLVGAGICKLIDGRFPDIDRVTPKKTEPAEVIGFNAGYLADIEKAAKLFNPRWSSVKLELQGNDSSAVANLSSPFGDTGKIVVMPMRL